MSNTKLSVLLVLFSSSGLTASAEAATLSNSQMVPTVDTAIREAVVSGGISPVLPNRKTIIRNAVNGKVVRPVPLKRSAQPVPTTAIRSTRHSESMLASYVGRNARVLASSEKKLETLIRGTDTATRQLRKQVALQMSITRELSQFHRDKRVRSGKALQDQFFVQDAEVKKRWGLTLDPQNARVRESFHAIRAGRRSSHRLMRLAVKSPAMRMLASKPSESASLITQALASGQTLPAEVRTELVRTLYRVAIHSEDVKARETVKGALAREMTQPFTGPAGPQFLARNLYLNLETAPQARKSALLAMESANSGNAAYSHYLLSQEQRGHARAQARIPFRLQRETNQPR